MQWLTDKSKLAFVLGSILLISLLGAGVLNYTVTRDAVRQEIMTSALPLTRDNIYSEIHGNLMQPIFISSLMANDTFLIDWAKHGEADEEKVTKYLKQIQEKYGFFATFFVSSQSLRYYHAGGVLKSLSFNDLHDAWFFRFTASGEEYVLDVDTNEAAENVLTIFINFRVEDQEGELLGVAGVGLKMDMVARLLEETQAKYGRTIYFVDREGLVQAHIDRAFIQSANIKNMSGVEQVADALLSQVAHPANYEFDRDDRHILLTVRYIPEFKWFLLVEQDETAALAGARSNFVRTVVIGLVAAAIVISLSLLTVNHFQHRLERMAVTDGLTGVANRRELERLFNLSVYRHSRDGTPFSAILFDVDGLKSINDTYGHLVGDDVIVAVARGVEKSLRPTDLLARWGGDEFVALVQCPQDGAVEMAERLRTVVMGLAREARGATRRQALQDVSISAGVAGYGQDEDLDELIKRADTAMYAAKRAGKNCVLSSDDAKS